MEGYSMDVAITDILGDAEVVFAPHRW